jgi:cobalt-zinc-cadmium resistance protein CzcA
MTRLRPVIDGLVIARLPVALATGTGRGCIATVVIGGLISATALTLVVLPALYAFFCRSPESTTVQQSGG